MATRKIVVRVMNDPKNKRTFKKFRMEEFPVMDFHETMQKLVDTYGEHLGFHEKESAEIGYIGYSNKKYKIASNDDLQKAFESGDLHKEKQPVFYICGKQEKAIKRAAQDFGNGKYLLHVFYLCRDIPKQMQRLQSDTEHCRLGYKIFVCPSGSIVVVLMSLCITQ